MLYKWYDGKKYRANKKNRSNLWKSETERDMRHLN